jgi:lysozyme family protein
MTLLAWIMSRVLGTPGTVPAASAGPVSVIGPIQVPPPKAAASPKATADSRFAACVRVVLRHEGGADNPKDPGGATKHGISLRHARSKGSMFDPDGDGDVDAADILLVTPAFGAGVYREWFWRDVRGDELPAGLDLVTFDFAVNSGPVRAIKALQAAFGVEADGHLGPKTRAAIEALSRDRVRDLVLAVSASRLTFLRGLKTWPTFGTGWARRVDEVRQLARMMAVSG